MRNHEDATATLNFNGGTLKSNYSDTRGLIASGVSVNVLAGGGTIDSGNNSIDVAAALSGEGAMTFKGGSAITLSGANTYTGGTVIELGTKVVASDATAKDTVVRNLVVDGRTKLAPGDYIVFECSEGGLSEDAASGIRYENCANGTNAKIVDGNKIVVTLSEPSSVPKNPSPVKVFEGKTLDDIAYGTFTSRMFGYAVSGFDEQDSVKGYNTKFARDSAGKLTSLVIEFQVWSNPYVKCVVVEFTDDGRDVFAKALDARYIENGTPGYVFYNGGTSFNGSQMSSGVATSYSAPGYGVCDIRVAVEAATEWTLDRDCKWSDLRKDAMLDGESVVRIKVAGDSPTLTIDEDVNVAKIVFVNGRDGVTTNSVAFSRDVEVSCGTMELGDSVCVKAGAFSQMSVMLRGISSILLYSSGEMVAVSKITGRGCVEVEPEATLNIDGDIGAEFILINNGTVVKRTEDTIALSFHNGSTGKTIVDSGTLKVASAIGSGSKHIVRVLSGAAFDMNGCKDFCPVVYLEGGARFENTGSNVGDSLAQAVGLVLEGDATVTAANEFGLLAPNWVETSLTLGSHTLTLDGGSSFWLSKTTIIGGGTIVVDNGSLTCIRSSSGEDCTLTIGKEGSVRIYGDYVFSVKNFVNNGTIYNDTGKIKVTGVLTAGNPLTKLTLADGATVKASATKAQVVSTTFTAIGSYSIDALAITKAQLKEAADERIPVLTVPTAQKGGAWTVANPPVDGCRAKWINNEDGTSTLYLCRSSGTMIIVR